MSAMKRLRLNLNLTSVIVIIAAGVLLPVMLSAVVGIVAITMAKNSATIVMGVLVISFTVPAAGCGLLALVFAGRKARLARQQADFIANISHEFRTPLSAIRLYAQTLQSGKLSDDPERISMCIETILRETTWLDVMIDKMLTWRASSKDRMPLNMVRQSLEEAVDGAISRFKSMVTPDEVTLSCQIDSHCSVLHDPSALNAVILNLLTNAYKYSGHHKQIDVTVQDQDGQVVINVKDNGIGLTKADAKQIFRPFYRVTRRDGRETSGVGLGLAIAYHLVNQHKGKIAVQSEEGDGTVFMISLPVVESAMEIEK